MPTISTARSVTTRHHNRIDQAIGWLIFVALLILTYGLFFRIPYAGFYSQTPDYQILEVFVSNAGLQPGDYLVQVGSLPITDYDQGSTESLMAGYQPGETVPIMINRAGQQIEVAWTLPGQTPAELWNRLSNQWWLAFIFWGTGQLALLFIWPRTERRQLFIAFCF
jgi:hypothetical protein